MGSKILPVVLKARRILLEIVEMPEEEIQEALSKTDTLHAAYPLLVWDVTHRQADGILRYSGVLERVLRMAREIRGLRDFPHVALHVKSTQWRYEEEAEDPVSLAESED